MHIYKYTASDNWPAAGGRTGIHIKQQADGEVVAGDRRSVGDINALTDPAEKPWTVVLHNKDNPNNVAIGEVRNDANNNSWGILTPGQFQCMCIIVALFEKEGDNKWSRAWLTHVSSQYADEVNQMIAKLNAGNYSKAYVAIGGQRGSLPAMLKIQAAFGGTEVPDNRPGPPPKVTPYPNPVFKPETVLIYAGGKNGEPFGFGLNKDGFVGEVTGVLA